jgi:hypothetical protein
VVHEEQCCGGTDGDGNQVDVDGADRESAGAADEVEGGEEENRDRIVHTRESSGNPTQPLSPLPDRESAGAADEVLGGEEEENGDSIAHTRESSGNETQENQPLSPPPSPPASPLDYLLLHRSQLGWTSTDREGKDERGISGASSDEFGFFARGTFVPVLRLSPASRDCRCTEGDACLFAHYSPDALPGLCEGGALGGNGGPLQPADVNTFPPQLPRLTAQVQTALPRRLGVAKMFSRAFRRSVRGRTKLGETESGELRPDTCAPGQRSDDDDCWPVPSQRWSGNLLFAWVAATLICLGGILLTLFLLLVAAVDQRTVKGRLNTIYENAESDEDISAIMSESVSAYWRRAAQAIALSVVSSFIVLDGLKVLFLVMHTVLGGRKASKLVGVRLVRGLMSAGLNLFG